MAGSNAPAGDESSLPIADDDFSSGGTAVRIASVAALGGLLFGYDSAVINGAVDSIQEDFGHRPTPNSASRWPRRCWGPRRSHDRRTDRRLDRPHRGHENRGGAVPYQRLRNGFAHEVWSVVLFRIVGGIGVGVAIGHRAGLYRLDFRLTRIRGRLGSLQQLAIVVWHPLHRSSSTGCCSGQRAARTRRCGRARRVALDVPRDGDSCHLYGVLAFTIPESPRYLVASHKIPEARRVLTMLLGEKNWKSRSVASGRRWSARTSRRCAI